MKISYKKPAARKCQQKKHSCQKNRATLSSKKQNNINQSGTARASLIEREVHTRYNAPYDI
jgi:hypothetical protein